MVTPTTDEIRAEALRVYMEESYRAGLKDIPTPEDHELKEENYWLRAQRDLMTSPEAKATDEFIAYLEYSASELEEVVVKSEDLKELLAASRKLEGIEDKIKDLRRKRRKEKEEAKLRIAELERKLEETRAPPPPKVIKAPPKPPGEPLCPAHKVELINVAATQPDTGWEFPWGRIYVPHEMFLFQCPQEFEYWICEPRKRCELVRLDLLKRRLAAIIKPIVTPRVREPILEAAEREPDFVTYLSEVGITMAEYGRLDNMGKFVMRQEYRRWKSGIFS